MSRLTSIALAFAVLTGACSADPSGSDLTSSGGSAATAADADAVTAEQRPDATGEVTSEGDDDASSPIIPDPDLDAADGSSTTDAGSDADDAPPDASEDATAPDAGGDAGTSTPDAAPDAAPPDTESPLGIVNLSATTVGASAVSLAWTAPEDPPGGSVSIYDLRYSKTNIASDADFVGASVASAPTPKAVGSAETFTVYGLDPDTTYYFAIRARDATGNVSPVSNIATAKTKVAAGILLSEVATDQATGYDFVELLVTTAGNIGGIEVRQVDSLAVLHTFADLDVAVGDRIVVHASGLPAPTGYAQEDITKNRSSSTAPNTLSSVDAWDVYSASTNVVGTDNFIDIVAGATVIDGVACSSRVGLASAAVMDAFAAASANGSWTFKQPPVDDVNDCATQLDAVGISRQFSETGAACGSFRTGMAGGKSINRVGLTDTNSKKDWYVAAVTSGAINTPIPSASFYLLPTSDNSIDLYFDQELDPTTVTASAFSGSGLTIQAATLIQPAIVTLTTSMLNGPHTVGADAPLKTIYGTPVSAARSFCGYGNAVFRFSELNPTIPGFIWTGEPVGADLVELVATKGGSAGSTSVELNPKATYPFGEGVGHAPDACVVAGDIVVVHLDPYISGTIRKSETVAKDEIPQASFNEFYDGAWDIQSFQFPNGTRGYGLSNGDGVVALSRPGAEFYDVVVYTNGNGNVTETPDFITSLQYVQSLGRWLPADCGGALCSASSTPTAEGVAVPLTGIGNSATGNSLRKTNIGDPSTAASWSVGPSSWGQAN